MDMTILGCSGSLSAPGNPASGYLLRTADGRQILMDVGPGVLARLQELGNPGDVDVVFSHLHPDHCSDFPSLVVWQRFHPTRAASDRHVLLGPSIAALHLGRASADHPSQVDDFSDILDVHSWRAPAAQDAPVVFDDTSRGTVYPGHRIGSATLYAAPAVHPTESYMIRVEDRDGSSLVYSGDTAATGHLAALAAGADVLLCEATWGERDNGDNPPQMHLSGEEAGQAAAEAGVGRLVITHV
ncbi:MAG: MBL fold metallo-hydrolase, partial [Corynebacterium sp.]|nr:MBL fold metallo-hydrolase [Corynebacterium sp.]